MGLCFHALSRDQRQLDEDIHLLVEKWLFSRGQKVNLNSTQVLVKIGPMSTKALKDNILFKWT